MKLKVGKVFVRFKVEEMLIVVLETCKNLCQQHNIQTDYQLGAVHIPGKSAPISRLYTRIKEAVDFPYYIWKSQQGSAAIFAVADIGTFPKDMGNHPIH